MRKGWDQSTFLTIPLALGVCLVVVSIVLLLSPAVWLQQTRIGLSLFDIQGLGYLKESVSVYTHQEHTYSALHTLRERTSAWEFLSSLIRMLKLHACTGTTVASLSPHHSSLSPSGLGELRPGAHSNPPSAKLSGGVLLFLLRLHCCAQVLLFPRPNEDR